MVGPQVPLEMRAQVLGLLGEAAQPALPLGAIEPSQGTPATNPPLDTRGDRVAVPRKIGESSCAEHAGVRPVAHDVEKPRSALVSDRGVLDEVEQPLVVVQVIRPQTLAAVVAN